MKNLLIFGSGVLTGVCLTILFAFILTLNDRTTNDRTTMFEQPGDVINVKALKVFQVVDKHAALVRESHNYTSDLVYLLINKDGEYYYDEEIVKLSKGNVVRQVGIYQYQTKSGYEKTVPIILIMNE